MKDLVARLQAMDIKDSDALLLIDVQNDFLPGGSLAVPGGDEIIPVIEEITPLFDKVILTQDWHPQDHSSFASNHPGANVFDLAEMDYGPQVLWPDHCVMGGNGAEINLPESVVKKATMVVRKGYRSAIDSYSAFFENDGKTSTGLKDSLADIGVKRIFVAGLATDYCVAFSALDARKLGIETVLVEDACRGISEAGIAAQKDAMKAAGVTFI